MVSIRATFMSKCQKFLLKLDEIWVKLDLSNLKKNLFQRKNNDDQRPLEKRKDSQNGFFEIPSRMLLTLAAYWGIGALVPIQCDKANFVFKF